MKYIKSKILCGALTLCAATGLTSCRDDFLKEDAGHKVTDLVLETSEGAEKMAAGARVKITLRCDECKQRNYNTVKNKKNTSDRLERSKYCPFCRKHTKHVETK